MKMSSAVQINFPDPPWITGYGFDMSNDVNVVFLFCRGLFLLFKQQYLYRITNSQSLTIFDTKISVSFDTDICSTILCDMSINCAIVR